MSGGSFSIALQSCRTDVSVIDAGSGVQITVSRSNDSVPFVMTTEIDYETAEALSNALAMASKKARPKKKTGKPKNGGVA